MDTQAMGHLFWGEQRQEGLGKTPQDICDRCEQSRPLVFRGLGDPHDTWGWGKFCATCWHIVVTAQEAPHG